MCRPRVEAERRQLNAEIADANDVIAQSHATEEEARAAASHVDDLRDEIGVTRLLARYPSIAFLENLAEGVRGSLEA